MERPSDTPAYTFLLPVQATVCLENDPHIPTENPSASGSLVPTWAGIAEVTVNCLQAKTTDDNYFGSRFTSVSFAQGSIASCMYVHGILQEDFRAGQYLWFHWEHP